MNLKQIKEAVRYYSGATSKHMKVLTDLAQAVLDCKGFPEKRNNKNIEDPNWDGDNGFDKAIDLCLIASKKDKLQDADNIQSIVSASRSCVSLRDSYKILIDGVEKFITREKEKLG